MNNISTSGPCIASHGRELNPLTSPPLPSQAPTSAASVHAVKSTADGTSFTSIDQIADNAIDAALALDWPAALPSTQPVLQLVKTPYHHMSTYSDDILPPDQWRMVSTPSRPSIHTPSTSTLSAASAVWSTAAEPPSTSHFKPPRVLDLFCGGGGSSLGFAAASFNIAAGVDNNADALNCFHANHPAARHLRLDLYNMDAALRALRPLPRFDLITISSPCTPFSTAGRLDPADPRIQLTFNGLKIAVALCPRAIVFENVPHLLQHNGGATWRTCLKILKDAGYHVQFRDDIDSQHFIPQRRRRLLLVATETDPGTSLDFDSAARQLLSRPVVTLADTFPHWKGRFYFHQNRGSGGKCLYALDDVSPPLRCNCGTIPRTAPKVSPLDAGPFSQRVVPTLPELAQIAGWPTHASLPPQRTKAGRILGNAVSPPVSEWLGGLILPYLRGQPPSVDHLVAQLDALQCSTDDSDALSNSAVCPPCDASLPAAHTPASADVLRLLRFQELRQPGAFSAPVSGTTDPQQLSMDAAVRDPEVHSDVAMHVAQLQRRERKRLALAMRTKITTDGTLRSLKDPIWSSPPTDAPPSSGNPAAMFAARPYDRKMEPETPTHPCAVSQRWRHWRAAHMLHCVRCQRYSTQRHNSPVPLAAIKTAIMNDDSPPSDSFTPDPQCYQAGMVEDVRVGFNPPFDPAPPDSKEIKNGSTCWDEWPM